LINVGGHSQTKRTDMKTTGMDGKGQKGSMEQLMPNGLTVAETNREMAKAAHGEVFA